MTATSESRWVDTPAHVSRLPGPGLPQGFRAAGVACGIKESGSPDLGLIARYPAGLRGRSDQPFRGFDAGFRATQLTDGLIDIDPNPALEASEILLGLRDLRLSFDNLDTRGFYFVIPRDDEANPFSTFTTPPNGWNPPDSVPGLRTPSR